VFHQAFIPAPHKYINSYEGENSNVLCQMWILKNLKEPLANLKAQNFSQINSIKTYDFLTLYTTILHDKLESRLLDIIDTCFFDKNGKRKCAYLVISHQIHYFVKYHSDSMHKYYEVEIKRCWNSS
jgi:hypothetical protein